jgi:hypothetical protein
VIQQQTKPDSLYYNDTITTVHSRLYVNHTRNAYLLCWKGALCQKALVDSVLGLPRDYTQTLTERGTTVTNINYCDMLRNELGPAICTKWRGRLSQDVVLLHNNACPHTAHLTINTI